ncbi:MAG: NAD-dependent epimerase/dehydratase family protein [Candidatus Brocadiia bacterium]
MPGMDAGKVVVFGAGGPVGAVIAPVLAEHYTLRLTDVADIDEVMARETSPIWPHWTEPPEPPHEWGLCDVTDYRRVCDAMEGCDAAINLAVNRSVPELAFRINVVGAYNIMKAAAETGLRRVVHTGVLQRTSGFEGDHRYEFGIPDDAPTRPGTELYGHTKHIGLHVVDAFAEREGVDVITLFLSRLRPADEYNGRDDDVVQSFSVAWEDLGPAYRCALRAPAMPHPNERFYICADLPMGKCSPEKAERLLGWKARHRFERFHTRPYRHDES